MITRWEKRRERVNKFDKGHQLHGMNENYTFGAAHNVVY